MTIKPLHDRVLILPFQSTGVTKGGIIIPDIAKEKIFRGTVVAIGYGKGIGLDDDKVSYIPLEPLTVKVDDNVIYGKFAGVEVIFDEISYLLMRESEILAVI